MEEEIRIIPDELYEEIVCQALEEDHQKRLEQIYWEDLYQELTWYNEARRRGWE